MPTYMFIVPMFVAYVGAMALAIGISRLASGDKGHRAWLIGILKWSSAGFFAGNALYLAAILCLVMATSLGPGFGDQLPEPIRLGGAIFLVGGPLLLSIIGLVAGAMIGHQRMAGDIA